MKNNNSSFTFLTDTEIALLSKNELNLYNQKVKNARDVKNVIDTAKEERSIKIAKKLIL